MEKQEVKPVVLSGIRATGRLHIGNYIGAMQDFVKLGADPSKFCMFFIANLHSITTKTDPAQMMEDLRQIVYDYLSVGIDPTRSLIYAQSSVPELCELSWILACLTNASELLGMHHFKDKTEKLVGLGRAANAGLLTYPVLMVADILGPRANIVPVGQDQEAHVELCRTLARRFNNEFGELFPIPDLLTRDAVRVPRLDGAGKMGKSDSSEDGVIWLSDPLDVAWDKFRRAVTDPARKRLKDPGDPEQCNIFTFHQLLSTDEEKAWAAAGCRAASFGCVECKKVVFQHLEAMLIPIQERRKELQAKGEATLVEDILHDHGKKARERIAPTVQKAKELVGIPMY